MSRQAAQTAIGPMVIAAVENSFLPSRRIFSDPFARDMLPFSGRVAAGLLSNPALRQMMIARTERDYPGLWPWMACRKRYIDEKITEAADGLKAVVNLGAGFDSRTLRLPAMQNLPVWEVDQPANIAAKRKGFVRIGKTLPGNLNLVPIDFDREDLATVMARSGYSANLKTFFIWEGVTQYVAEPGIRATLDFLARAAAGSTLAFTYVLKALFEGSPPAGAELLHKRFVATRVWQYGVDPEAVEGLLQPYGWRVAEEVGPDQLSPRYVAPTGRKLKTAPAFERIVLARKM